VSLIFNIGKNPKRQPEHLVFICRNIIIDMHMKTTSLVLITSIACSFACSHQGSRAITQKPAGSKNSKQLFLDVHNIGPGKVTFDAVAGAHQKDLATQGKFGVNFIKYWVDESAGKVYCLVESPDSVSVYNTHKEAHGLVPDLVHPVTDGPEAVINPKATLFLDVHQLGANSGVTAEAVAKAHEKDLATQDKYGVKFINYWFDQKSGVVMCLAESKDSAAVIATHKEAHGLLPNEIKEVKQGQ
jgi:hypothetical protein